MLKKLSCISAFMLIPCIVLADKLESIFIVPDVFVTSKLKPTKEYESERGNILFEGHDIEVSRQYSIGDMLKDLPGISSQGLGNATRPIIRGMTNSRVKILQNSSTLSDVSEFGEEHVSKQGGVWKSWIFAPLGLKLKNRVFDGLASQQVKSFRELG